MQPWRFCSLSSEGTAAVGAGSTALASGDEVLKRRKLSKNHHEDGLDPLDPFEEVEMQPGIVPGLEHAGGSTSVVGGAAAVASRNEGGDPRVDLERDRAAKDPRLDHMMNIMEAHMNLVNHLLAHAATTAGALALGLEPAAAVAATTPVVDPAAAVPSDTGILGNASPGLD